MKEVVPVNSTTFPATPYAGREIAFTMFGAGQQSVWRQRLVMSARVIPVPNQRLNVTDLQQTPTGDGHRSAAKPGSPPRGVPR
jgi:hypothetical protein